MGVVTESNVQAALTYLADDPHPVARAVKMVADAENECDATFARVYLSASGGAELRKQIAADHPDVKAAKAALSGAKEELQRHRSRVHAADSLLEIFRTENANARAAERIR
jgi:poly(3-hydroxybutyrate) depolymerase